MKKKVEMQKSGYSFCIITDNHEPRKLQKEISSIEALKIINFEIIVEIDNIPPQGRISALRNKVCKKAVFDHIVLADDDLIFHEDFYLGLQKFGEDYDVMVCKILNPDGSRFYDWKIIENGKNYLLDYDESDPNVSLTGGLIIMKSWVFNRVQMNENLGFYEGEDVDYTQRLKDAGIRISLNQYCTVTHDAPYKQAGRRVLRMNFRGWISYLKYVIYSKIFGVKDL